LFIGEEVAGGVLAGYGLVLSHASQLPLVEDGSFATHEAVLVGSYDSIGVGIGIADVEDAAVVGLVSIVAVGTIHATERRS